MKFDVKAELKLDVAAAQDAIRDAVREALQQSVDIVVADAKALAAPMRKSGALEASIGGEVGEGLAATVWAKKFYARFIEFGTKHARAKPFMRPAIVAARARVVALITAAVAGAWEGKDLIAASKRRPTAQAAPPPGSTPQPQRPPPEKRKRTREEWRAYGHWKKHRNDRTGGVNATGRSTRPGRH